MIGGCKEIRDEMIYQEATRTDKSSEDIGKEYGVHRATVWRIKKKKDKEYQSKNTVTDR